MLMNRRKLICGALNHYTLKRKLYPLLLLFLSGWALQAQDIHYSQFYNAPMNINPALTGIFRGDARFMGNYRQQWTPWVRYLTFTGVADMKFYPKAPRNGFFSGGLEFNYDQAGDSKLQLLHLGLSGSYTRRMSNHAYLTFGAQLSGNQRGFKLGALSFDEQYDPGRNRYDPSLDPGEINLNNKTNFFLDLGAGLNFRLQSLSDAELVDEMKQRSKLDLGIGIFHLNRPDQSFYEGYKSKMFMRVSPYAAGTLQISEDLDVVGHFNLQIQGPYREYLALAALKAHLNLKSAPPNKFLSLQAGIGLRFDEFGDALYPTLEGNYGPWRVGLSWDVNISDAKAATNRNGGPEISLQYIISKPLPKFKACPLI